MLYTYHIQNTYIFFLPSDSINNIPEATENLKSVESIKKQTLVTIPATRGTTNDISFLVFSQFLTVRLFEIPFSTEKLILWGRNKKGTGA